MSLVHALLDLGEDGQHFGAVAVVEHDDLVRLEGLGFEFGVVATADLRAGEVGHGETDRVTQHQRCQLGLVLEQPYLQLVVESGHGMKLQSVVA
ncbi:hypothetical protein [Nocardiopsis oceani]